MFLSLRGAIVCACALLPATQPAWAGEADDYSSQHFLVHTDLDKAPAGELLDRLEVMVGLISAYWGKAPVGTIECFVVVDADSWPTGRFPLPGAALAKIRGGAGMTVSRTRKSPLGIEGHAIVYATAANSVAQHEAVHAYCRQTFGEVGAPWYAEGMAEVGQYWRAGDLGVNCDRRVVRYLRSEKPRDLADIVGPQEVPGSVEEYAWRWAVCHVLTFTPAYKERFQAFGRSMLQGKRSSFDRVFGAVRHEIDFEYRFFLEHFDLGYRVDLCDWDWKKKFQAFRETKAFEVEVAAGRGWQPTGGLCRAGAVYSYKAAGRWGLSKDGPDVSADGAEDGAGRLVGTFLKDFELSEPFELGESGAFTAPQDGKLYLRCRDAWNELADNRGNVTVQLQWNDRAAVNDAAPDVP